MGARVPFGRSGRKWIAAVFELVCLALPLLWLYRAPLLQGETFAYRDAARYYYPLEHYVQTRWSHGSLPLWNPLDGLGQPLLGDPTAAILYPGKLLYGLPLPFSTCFSIYIFSHSLWGGWGACRCARAWRIPGYAPLLAGLSYELSGPVVFQYCNPIYLVGAAWLPWGLLFLDQTVRTTGGGSILGLAITLAMTTLGGDPQMSVHLGLIGLGYVVLRGWGGLAWGPGLRRLLLAAMLAILLAAGQVLPAAAWARQSDRCADTIPRSIPAWLASSLQAFRRGEPNWPSLSGIWRSDGQDTSHAEKMMDFSIGPWRWIETIWPNIGGKSFPEHRRWWTAIPAEGRTWSPSLYLGLIPAVLGIGQLRWRVQRSGQLRTYWLSWIWVLSLTGTLGQYGLGWMWREISFTLTGANATPIVDGLGGIYWWLTILVPTYAEFRYPAKLWTITTLAWSLLAARGLALWEGKRSKTNTTRAWYPNTFFGITIVTSLVLLAWIVAKDEIVATARLWPASELLGPFRAEQAWFDTGYGLAQSFLVALFAGILLVRRNARNVPTALLIVIATTLELVLAHGWMVVAIPDSHWQTSRRSTQDNPRRVMRGPHTLPRPRDWSTISSPDRLAELLEFERETFMPKYHMLDGIANVGIAGPFTYASLQGVLDEGMPMDEIRFADPKMRQNLWDALGISDIWLPEGQQAPSGWTLAHGENNNKYSIVHYTRQEPLSRVWIAHEWSTVPRDSPPSRKELRTRIAEMAKKGNLRCSPWVSELVESGPLLDEQTDLWGMNSTRWENATDRGETCELTLDTPERVQIHAHLVTTGMVVLADQYDGDWRVTVRPIGGQSAADSWVCELLQVNYVTRGVLLPPGEFEIEFQYVPLIAYAGLGISGVSWALSIVYLLSQMGRWQADSQGASRLFSATVSIILATKREAV